MNRPTDKQLEEVLAGVASSEDAKLVAEWFATEAGSAYLESAMTSDLEEMKAELVDLYVAHGIPTEQMFRRIEQNIQKKRMRRILFRVAAVLIPVLFLVGFYIQLNSRVDLFGISEYEEIVVAKGERIQMAFQDGTRVYINADSKLKYPKKFALNSREVYLQGEAYFVVAKNEHRPFIVNLNGSSVHVLGTSFNVQDYPEDKNTVICLDEGKVNLILPSEKKYTMHPGQQLVYNKELKQCTITRKSDNLQRSLWKKEIIVFKDTPLDDVIQILARWYGVTFIVSDPRVSSYLYTLTSDNALLEKVLGDMEKIAPVRFEYNEDKKEVIVRMK